MCISKQINKKIADGSGDLFNVLTSNKINISNISHMPVATFLLRFDIHVRWWCLLTIWSFNAFGWVTSESHQFPAFWPIRYGYRRKIWSVSASFANSKFTCHLKCLFAWFSNYDQTKKRLRKTSKFESLENNEHDHLPIGCFAWKFCLSLTIS